MPVLLHYCLNCEKYFEFNSEVRKIYVNHLFSVDRTFGFTKNKIFSIVKIKCVREKQVYPHVKIILHQ